MQKIDPDIPISQLIDKYPQVVDYLISEYQFHCIGCFISQFENLRDGAAVHGIVGADFDQLIIELEDLVNNRVKPQSIDQGINLSQAKVVVVNLAGTYFQGEGITDQLPMFSAIKNKHGYPPSRFIRAFNNLYPLYLRSELKQVDLWEMINEKYKIDIDASQDWFGQFTFPQINDEVSKQIEILKNQSKRVIGVIDIGTEQAVKMDLDSTQHNLFDYIYRSDLVGSTRTEYRFWQYLIAREGVRGKQIFVIDRDKKTRELLKELGITSANTMDVVTAAKPV